MTYNIAVAGKGGVGKTSLTGLLIDTLVKQKKDPILVVDADANCNLYEVLGTEEPETIGHIREVANMTEKNGDSDRKSTRLNSSHQPQSRMPSSA